MNTSLVRIETLNRENYDTWKIQMEALLTKTEKWTYVNGKTEKPPATPGNKEEEKLATWVRNDGIAKSDIIFSMSPRELKLIKGCNTSREVWQKLQEIYKQKDLHGKRHC